MTLFNPAIALMNRLKYPQKFFLISLLFVLPLALVMNLLLSELDSRIAFTQKELYGNAYLRPISQLWKYIPQRELILQRQFHKNAQKSEKALQTQTQELLDLENKIDQSYATLSNVDKKLGRLVQTGDKLSNLNFRWQSLRNSQNLSEFSNHELLLDQLNLFRVHIVDFSNLILDPDLDTYYLMDASAVKLPEMQKLLHRIMQTEAEIVFEKKVTNEKRALLISLTSLLDTHNNELVSNLERAFKNNPRGNLRNSLNISLRNLFVSVAEVNTYTNQLVSPENNFPLAESFYQQEMESTLESI